MSTSKHVWRRKEILGGTPKHQDGTPQAHSCGPLARVGELFPPQPAARSNDSIQIHAAKANIHNPPAPNTERYTEESAPHNTSTPTEEPRKLFATIPETFLATLRANCEAKASVSLLGTIQGKHPGLQALTTWARDTLHRSLSLLSLKANNVFEITFESPEGRIHALNQADLVCELAAIFLSRWRPHFDPKTPHATDRLDHPVWVQIVDLCQILREETFMRAIGEHIGQVISIDSSEAYKAKLFGPRIRLLVRDLHDLPHVVVVPRLDGDGTVEYALEFSGLPNQCGRCRTHDHQVRKCPRKTTKGRRIRRYHTAPYKRSQQHIMEPREVDNTDSTQPIHAHTTPQAPVDHPKTRTDTLNAVSIQPACTEEDKVQAPTLQPTPLPAASKCSPRNQTNDPCEGSTSMPPNLPTDEINFPKLPSFGHKEPQPEEDPKHKEPPTFIWRSKPTFTPLQADTSIGKEKRKVSGPSRMDSTPITRQGYRTG